jgi:hypothetical protein
MGQEQLAPELFYGISDALLGLQVRLQKPARV